MISAIILNWKRPANVARIVEGWRAGGIVTDAIVVNNNKETTVSHPFARCLNSNTDFSLYSRFAISLLAKHECVLWQDDDLELPPASLARLMEAWKEYPDRLHGVFGRGPRLDGSYAQDYRGDYNVPVVLTRCLLGHRKYAAKFFEHLPKFEHLQRETKPFGNGEDIIFSYVARRESGSLNRIHNVAVKELPAPHAIHARPGHFGHRTKLMRACEAWIDDDRAKWERLATSGIPLGGLK